MVSDSATTPGADYASYGCKHNMGQIVDVVKAIVNIPVYFKYVHDQQATCQSPGDLQLD